MKLKKINLWESKVNVASSMKDLNMLSEDWIYKNVFNFSPKEIDTERDEVVEDVKQKYRLGQIESEGTDPAKNTDQIDDRENDDFELEGEKDLGGRPKERDGRYGTDSHPLGRDPIGAKSIRPTKSNGSQLSTKYKGGSPLARENTELIKTLKREMDVKSSQKLIKEDFNRKKDNKKNKYRCRYYT